MIIAIRENKIFYKTWFPDQIIFYNLFSKPSRNLVVIVLLRSNLLNVTSDMKSSYCYLFTLGLLILFGVSTSFSYDLIFAQVETPDGPTDLDADVVSSTQIDLSWSKSDDTDTTITGYKIETRVNTDPDYSVIVEDTGSTDTEYSHTGLTPDTIYAYRVYAINPNGTSESYDTATVKTSENDTSDGSDDSIADSDVPSNVKVKAISSTSVELTWDPPTRTYEQSIQSYTIKQELISGVYEDVGNASGSDSKYTISSLSEDKSYEFVVAANYSLGSSDNSDSVKVTLNSSSDDDDDKKDDDDDKKDDDDDKTVDDVPDRPTDLKADAVSSTKIDLSWDAPDADKSDNNDEVTGYMIEGKETH